jgi:chemotaxis protein methyltransferase CheR
MTVSAADFSYLREMLAIDSAMALADGKEYLVQSRLAPVAEREGLRSVGELIDRVRSGSDDLRRQVVEALVTHETSFFRDVHPFDALRDEVVPALVSANGGAGLSFWSAATSTGQEAYSLALLMRESFPEVTNLTILASDISTQALARARTGRFSQLEVSRGLPAKLLIKYFDQDGREWVLQRDVCDMVRFRQVNLARPLVGLPSMDVVFLRNVLIYFDTAAKMALLDQMSRVMRPGGYLFLGGAEWIGAMHPGFTRVQLGRSVAYRRVV